MKVFKFLKVKVVIITIIVVLVNFLAPKPVYGKSFIIQAGGILLEPVSELLVFVRRLCT